MEEAQQAAAGGPSAGGPFNAGRTAAGGQRYGWYAPPHMRQRQWNQNNQGGPFQGGPFQGGPFRGNEGPRPFWARGKKEQQQQQGSKFSQQPGPVIDAEWETVDD